MFARTFCRQEFPSLSSLRYIYIYCISNLLRIISVTFRSVIIYRLPILLIIAIQFPVIVSTMWGNLNRPYIEGGCLTNIYDLCSMTFHWGQSNDEGSEHTLDYVRYPMELQVWHIKRGFNTLLEAIAAKESDGILIISFFFQVKSYLIVFQVSTKLCMEVEKLPF